MAIGTPLHIVNHATGVLTKKAEVLPVYKNLMYPTNVRDVIVIRRENIALIVLQTPFWRAGWAGLSFVKDI